MYLLDGVANAGDKACFDKFFEVEKRW